MIVAATILGLTYLLISLPKVPWLNLDRPSAALLGGVLMVVCGVLTLEEAYRAINYDTLALLLGMMVIVAYLKSARFFGYASAWILQKSASPRQMLVLLVFASGVLSAIFVNDTICLLCTPIVLRTVLRARLNPIPYLIALVTSSNVGSAMTLTGNPQNMLIGISSQISFGRFFLVCFPVGLVSLALVAALLLLLYRGHIPAHFHRSVGALPRTNRVVVQRMAAVLILVLAGFFVPLGRWLPGVTHGQQMPLFALVGALAAILVGRYKPRQTLRQVDWSLLLFFAGLFVVTEGVAHVGLLKALREAMAPLWGTSEGQQVASFTAFSVLASNLVSNVPYVLVARDWIGSFANPQLMWYILAMASTFAGNLTIVGSMANMIVLEESKDEVPIGFMTYFRAGLPITLVTIAVGALMLWGMERMGLPL